MGARDRRQADALDRAWDALLGRAVEPPRPGELDPTLAAVPRRLAALDRAAAAGRGRVPSWTEVAGGLVRGPARQRAVRGPAWTSALLPAPGKVFRPAASRRRRPPARWWPALEFAGAVSLIVALFGFAMGWGLNLPGDTPSAQPTPLFGAASTTPDSATAATEPIPPCDPSTASAEFPDFDVPARWDQRGAADEPFVHVKTTVEVGDLLIIGGSGARGEGAAAVMAVDARTGEERWYQWTDPVEAFVGDVPFGGARVTSILATPKLVFAVTDMGLVSVLDPATGRILRQTLAGPGKGQSWSVELGLGNQGATVFVAVAGTSPGGYLQDIGLSVTEEAVLVTSNTPGGYLGALNAGDGEEIWEVQITSEHVPEPSLLAFDSVTGALRWRQGFAEHLPSPATAGDGAVYLTTGGGETVAYALADGAELWQSGAAGAALLIQRGGNEGGPIPDSVQFVGNTLAVADGTLFVAAADMIAALDPMDGTARWCAPVGATYHLTASAGIVFAGTPAGIYALDAATGTPLWVIWARLNEIGMPIQLYPAVFAGTLYVRDWKQVAAYDLKVTIPPSTGAEPLPSDPPPANLPSIPTVTVWSNAKRP